jgi:putative flippase GtrA
VFRFYAVGFIGILVQLAVLQALAEGVRTNYLVATALAVEIAVIHNFLWHDRWTWRSRTSGTDSLALRLTRFWKFNLSTGAVSLATNIIVTSLLVEAGRVPYLVANLIAIAVGSAGTFLLGELVVFPARASERVQGSG